MGLMQPIAAAESVPVPVPAPGWRLELLAQAPEVSHPSVITSAPDGRIFVAEDPMDIREDVKADATAGRIWCLGPGRSRTLFATNLHAVFGLQYLEGKLYVLHNPTLTVFRDDAGVGREARELLTHTLREPWGLGWNDHVPANFKLGMDGYFYLAVGDKGLEDCTGTDGRKLSLPGGGVVRFRPDGSGLEVFASGVRNILDVALNAEDDCFTYDNTDEHQWMGRLTHMVEAGFYGYPHDFIPRRPYTLWMMHDFGAGAACGTVCNTDDGLPPEMAGNLFLSDFGKRQILRVHVERAGASYRMAGSEELFPNPPDDFRPVGIAWSSDARSLLVCDWQYRDQKANVSVGRVWKLTRTDANPMARPSWWVDLASGRDPASPVATADLLAALAHPARAVRLTAQRALSVRAAGPDGPPVVADLEKIMTSTMATSRVRTHALWALAAVDGGRGSRAATVALARGENADLAAQALRHLSQQRAIEALPVAMDALTNTAAPVRLQAATLLGRVPSVKSVATLMVALADESDEVVRYAVFTALHRLAMQLPEAVGALVDGLNSPVPNVRSGCEWALRDVYTPTVVMQLGQRATTSSGPGTLAALRLLGPLALRVPAGRYVWGAYHPAEDPAPAHTESWAGTESARVALRRASGQTDETVRATAIVALGDARDSASVPVLRQRLTNDPVERIRSVSLAALNQVDPSGTPTTALELLELESAPAVRLAALEILAAAPPAGSSPRLLPLLTAGTTAEKPLVLRALARLADPANTTALLAAAEAAELRPLAIRALAAVPDLRSVPRFLEALGSADPVAVADVRKALAKLGVAALPEIVRRADSLPPGVRGTLRDIFKDVPEVRNHPLFANLPVADPVLYADFARQHSGDPWRGQQLFFGSAGVACTACHQVAGQGGIIGPDLTLAGRQFGRAEIIESILYPSRIVREGYRQCVITTTDGRELIGALRSETVAGLTLVDAAGGATVVPPAEIKERRDLPDSLMPEGLHAALTLEQFADLVAYVASRTVDPRVDSAPPLPGGFVPLFNGHDLTGWRMTDENRAHWSVKSGRIRHDGVGGDLWNERDLVDFDLLVEWRWPGVPQLVDFPVINDEGLQLERTERVLDAGDSGVFLRGLYKAQANLFCYPVGSGEFWEYRESLTGAARKAVTPRRRADAPIGDWNVLRAEMRGDRVTVRLNGEEVIHQAALPGIPSRGPMGFQHEHGELEIRTVAVRVIP